MSYICPIKIGEVRFPLLAKILMIEFNNHIFYQISIESNTLTIQYLRIIFKKLIHVNSLSHNQHHKSKKCFLNNSNALFLLSFASIDGVYPHSHTASSK